MTTFDKILPTLAKLLQDQRSDVEPHLPLFVNCDLNGRARIILDAKHEPDEGDDFSDALQRLAASIHKHLIPHTTTSERIWLFGNDLDALRELPQTFPLHDSKGNCIPDVFVVDRLASEATWASIRQKSSCGDSIPRVVFYAMKGGVGRSTAVAACAFAMARAGRRVLVLDLDLESPGLSASLLPPDRQPAFGITDWLVEDLVNNGNAVSGALSAISPLSSASGGEIRVVPAHGREPGEYLSKLGRIWMPKFVDGGRREVWSERLERLIQELEQQHQPDMVLIDSRAGIDEVASACITDLGASRIYLFALDSQQTWSSYRMLFQHWRQHNGAGQIRDCLKIVGAMIPPWGDKSEIEASNALRENAYDLFLETIYDEDPAPSGQLSDNPSQDSFDSFSFDLRDQDAPHNPCCIPWNQGFAAIQSHYDRLNDMDSRLVDLVYGGLVADLNSLLRKEP
ncbi:MAG: hypothetical protein TH68_05640 [Candidatus Synechococcus spongiarum 142]|uniref:CobQ/CobB/MinD/ParA nucleotide binding domain-containing protein n=1 Tax=Candidatus Synechococcus spongiarum 142 TaxID=1608213 RepID=A0A6N3XCA8_9SYNE|nr:MAG: hypothetical protein TH68_05640 [Candidatus Synechococcus spongiarum 142]